MTEYESYRKNVKSGDLIAVSHTGWKSLNDALCQIVRLGQRSEYCHVGLVWRVSGRLFVIESVKPVVRITPLSHFAEKGFYHVPLKKSVSAQELEFALSQVGVGEYSNLQALKGFFKHLTIGEDDFWQCAEFVIACRKISGVDLGQVATPSEVVKAALEQGYEINYIKN